MDETVTEESMKNHIVRQSKRQILNDNKPCKRSE